MVHTCGTFSGCGQGNDTRRSLEVAGVGRTVVSSQSPWPGWPRSCIPSHLPLGRSPVSGFSCSRCGWNHAGVDRGVSVFGGATC